jgi:hypothetical protein
MLRKPTKPTVITAVLGALAMLVLFVLPTEHEPGPVVGLLPKQLRRGWTTT